jgi:MraZ protein
MLRGKFISVMDKWGRVRIPKALQRIIEVKYGNEVFITTVDVRDVRIYPLSEWELIEKKMREQYKENRIIQKVMERTAFFGLVGKIDKQGRILIHKLLREKIKLEGKILIEGKGKYLKVSSLQ